MIEGVTLHQLHCFDAVVAEGGFQPAAEKLRRAQPTVFAAVKNLETQLGLTLLDRSGYRVALTEVGRSFHDRARLFLREFHDLQNHARQLAMGEESELSVVIGDLCPVPEVLALLRSFFDSHPGTRLHLHVEAIAGPWERLFDGEADLIIHHIDKADPRLEFIDLCAIKLIPVVAPGFLHMPISEEITPEQMRSYIQCVIRDTARHSPQPNFYIIEGAQSWTVGDQLMKKEIIMQGAAWGHLHDFLIEQELHDGRLLSIAGRHLQGGRIELTAARRRDMLHGPIANLLWRHIEQRSAAFKVNGKLTGSRP
jgi:DNA-binding transcriptional LysR family regulator